MPRLRMLDVPGWIMEIRDGHDFSIESLIVEPCPDHRLTLRPCPWIIGPRVGLSAPDGDTDGWVCLDRRTNQARVTSMEGLEPSEDHG